MHHFISVSSSYPRMPITLEESKSSDLVTLLNYSRVQSFWQVEAIFFLSLAILCHIMCENAFVFTLRQSCEFYCWFVIVWFSSNVYVIMFTEDSGMWWFTASFQVLKMLWTIFNSALLVSNICLVFYFVNNFMLTKHSSIFSDTTRLDAFNGLMNFVVLVWIHLK